MLANFGEIKNEVLSFLKIDSDNVDEAILTSIELRINQVQDWIIFKEAWEWRKRTFYFTTRKPHEDGTIAVIENSKTITGTSSNWTIDMKLGSLLIGSKIFKIQNIVSDTSLTLEAPYPDDTESGTSYKIVFPDYPLDEQISLITSIRHEEVELNVVNRDRLLDRISLITDLERVAFGDRLRDDFFNSGTVEVTQGSPTITLASSTFPSNIDGFPLRVNEFSKDYTIKTRDSDTQLTLRENYEGDSGSGKSYTILPSGSQLLTFAPVPDDFNFVTIEALIKGQKLINNIDYSIIPNHAPLLHGAIWLAAVDFKNENPVRIQQARADFERSMLELKKQFKAHTNIRWQSESEIAIKQHGITTFDPLNLRRHR